MPSVFENLKRQLALRDTQRNSQALSEQQNRAKEEARMEIVRKKQKESIEKWDPVVRGMFKDLIDNFFPNFVQDKDDWIMGREDVRWSGSGDFDTSYTFVDPAISMMCVFDTQGNLLTFKCIYNIYTYRGRKSYSVSVYPSEKNIQAVLEKAAKALLRL